jgi:hypothetical protein
MIVRNGNAPCHHAPGCPHDLGPASPAPLRGFSHRGHTVPGGSFARPLPAREAPLTRPLPEGASEEVRAYEHRLQQLRLAARRYRARKREEAHQRYAAADRVTA